MTDPRQAPYPADTRAKGWRFELDLEQVRQSTTWARTKPEARAWLLMLWAVSWEQVPCGSLPDDREAVAGLLGIPEKLWERHAEALLRGWWVADDGRLYHDTLSTRVAEMMKRRRSDSARQAANRARLAAESAQSHSDVTRDTAVTPGGVGAESSTDNRQPNKEKNPSGSSPGATRTPSIPCPYQSIVDLYHERLPMLPRVKLMTEARQKAMRKTWGWVLNSVKSDGERRATNADEALHWLGDYFGRAAENDWLTGRTGRTGAHANWQCDLDFLLTEKGMKHVIEKTREAA